MSNTHLLTPVRRSTLLEQVTANLRGAIVEGHLNPGTPLRQDELAKSFGVSAIPVREALRRLEVEGLVVFASRRGATVAPLNAQEVLEFSEMRAALERLALVNSLPKLKEEVFRECEHALDALDRTTNPKKWGELNFEFHQNLYSGAERPHLMNLIRSLHLKIERYLRFHFSHLGYFTVSQREHRELLRVCKERNVEHAADLLERHILQGGHKLYMYLRSQGPVVS
jgi:DNA-binding GntR family transcriptional regulator